MESVCGYLSHVSFHQSDVSFSALSACRTQLAQLYNMLTIYKTKVSALVILAITKINDTTLQQNNHNYSLVGHTDTSLVPRTP